MNGVQQINDLIQCIEIGFPEWTLKVAIPTGGHPFITLENGGKNIVVQTGVKMGNSGGREDDRFQIVKATVFASVSVTEGNTVGIDKRDGWSIEGVMRALWDAVNLIEAEEANLYCEEYICFRDSVSSANEAKEIFISHYGEDNFVQFIEESNSVY